MNRTNELACSFTPTPSCLYYSLSVVFGNENLKSWLLQYNVFLCNAGFIYHRMYFH